MNDEEHSGYKSCPYCNEKRWIYDDRPVEEYTCNGCGGIVKGYWDEDEFNPVTAHRDPNLPPPRPRLQTPEEEERLMGIICKELIDCYLKDGDIYKKDGVIHITVQGWKKYDNLGWLEGMPSP